VDFSAAPENTGQLWVMPDASYEIPGLPSWLHLQGIDSELLLRQAEHRDLLKVLAKQWRKEEGWKVIFDHHPVASTGLHVADPEEKDDETMTELLAPLTKVGWSVLLSGHDHDQEILQEGSILQIVQGSSSKLRELGHSAYDGCSHWARSGYGFAILVFTESSLTIEFYSEEGTLVHTETASQPIKADFPSACPSSL